MTLSTLLKTNKELEDLAVLDLDAVLHKATQEVGEVLEASQENDLNHLIEETGDAILNILSVMYRLDPTQEIALWTIDTPVTLIDIAIQHAKRNDFVQKNRWIYARRTVDIATVKEATTKLVTSILSLTNTQAKTAFSLEEIIAPTVQKFVDRAEAYGPHIAIAEHIRDVPNFPQQGIMFKDIGPLLWNPRASRYVTQEIAERLRHKNIDAIIGLDARWFLFWKSVADELWKPFVMVRKDGKLPGELLKDEYQKEYWSSDIQTMDSNSLQPWRRVAIIDDVLATWWTALSAARLVEQASCINEWLYFLMWLDYLPWKELLKKHWYHYETLIDYK
jgi:adenine phosphoribosyltransferase